MCVIKLLVFHEKKKEKQIFAILTSLNSHLSGPFRSIITLVVRSCAIKNNALAFQILNHGHYQCNFVSKEINN